MGSNDKYEKHLPAFSPPVFHDPFASIEGGVGSLSTKSDANRTHVSSIATSTISVQCANFDGENDSTDPSCITTTSPPYSISRDVSPTRHSPARNDEEGGTAPSMSLYSRENEEFLSPSAELGFLDIDRPGSPSSCESPNSFDPNVTPHPCSSIGDHDHGANFDGWADLPKSYGARLSPIPFTTSPASMTRSTSIAASVESYRSVQSTDEDWNIETLRELTDVVREAFQLGSPPSAHLEILSEILKALLFDEQSKSTAVGLDLIAMTYFDKTLDAILSQTTKNMAISEASIQEIFSRATSLQHKWQQRFKEEYFSIDYIRIKDIREGALRDVTLNVEDWKNDKIWLVAHNEPISHHQGDVGFEVGSWWLNIACAFRDGIVGGTDEKATKGPYNVTALPLLTGEEVEGPTLNMYEYTKRGTSKEMPFSILGNRGGPIRILRGHALKSKFAPKIGVRYDGLHVVKQYGHKLIDQNNNIYQCRLVLERATGQKPINDIILPLTPSQMDDWALYIRIVGEQIRARQGDVAYNEWREFLDAQRMAKEEYIQKKALGASFPRYKLITRKRIMS